MGDMLRYLVLFFYKLTNNLPLLYERANYTAIGFTGHISAMDEEIAKEKNLKHLNRLEMWFLGPAIEHEKKRRRVFLKKSVLEVTGENIDDRELGI